ARRAWRRSSPRCGPSAGSTAATRPFSCTCCCPSRRWSFARRSLPWIRTRRCRPRSRPCSARAACSWNMPEELEFEKPLLEIENRITELRASGDQAAVRGQIARLEGRLGRLQQKVYGNLTAWQRAQLARHPKRPHTLDLFQLLLEDFVELHGDRVFGD